MTQSTSPRLDVVILIETTSPAAARELQQTQEYHKLIQVLDGRASDMPVILASNARRVADVDMTRQALSLFNYFVAEDPEVAVAMGLPCGVVRSGDRPG